MDEIEILAAFHLEAWTAETDAELFARACAVLRAAGIRVKGGYAPTVRDWESAYALSKILYPRQ